MCGICGIYGEVSDASRVVRNMNSVMLHRGPDDEGYYIEGEIALGMRRLAIIDLSPSGHQPMTNETGEIVVIFNGEIYNFLELKAVLESKGHHFKSQTDTECILHAYEEYGPDCVHKFRGMFAFAIYDKTRRELFIARDRLGVKPLYYAKLGGRLVFASEVKALLSSGLISKRINFQAVHHFLSFGSVPNSMTMFRDVEVLPPGHTLFLRKNSDPVIRKYWDPIDFCDPKPASFNHAVEQIREIVEEAVKIRLISDVPLGVFFSSGLDSGIIAGIMKQTFGANVKGFTVGFSDSSSANEAPIATRAAKELLIDHATSIVSGEDAVADLENVISAMNQPSYDGLNTWFVSGFARRRVTVALSGLGADEIFWGYRHFRRIPQYIGLARVWKRIIPSDKHSSLARLLRRSLFSHNAKLDKMLLLSSNDVSPELVQVYSLYRFLQPEEWKTNLYSKEFLAELGYAVPSMDLLHPLLAGFEMQWGVEKAISVLEIKNYLANILLADSDSMSMAHSLEVRFPFLDHKLVEYMLNLDSRLFIRSIREKGLLKKAFSDLLPSVTIGRKKQGFELPMKQWMKTALKEVVEDALSEASIKKRGFFEPATIGEYYKLFSRDTKSRWEPIWSLVVLELWLRSLEV